MGKKQKKNNKAAKKRKKVKDGHLKVALECIEQWFRGSNALLDLHTHSTCSDGLLSPDRLVERAFKRGVRVLALTDHDTMAGIPAAILAARKYGVRIIPGVEISTRFVNSSGVMKDSVHILALYGCCGPSGGLEEKLAHIREGRYERARGMVQKLHEMKRPVRWESVLEIAGPGVAPGRPHVARALLQAGYVASYSEAFHKYIGDDGPAFATGFELPAAEAVQLIIQTGGIAVLAHPWSLKNPLDVIQQLKAAGLHAMEVYKASGKDKGFAALAETFQLIKLGGSDYHATGAADETELGKVELPPGALQEFLKTAIPLWSSSVQQILSSFAAGTLQRPFQNGASPAEFLCGDVELLREGEAVVGLRLSPWLSEEERQLLTESVDALGLSCDVEDESMIIRKRV